MTEFIDVINQKCELGYFCRSYLEPILNLGLHSKNWKLGLKFYFLLKSGK